MNKSFRSFMQSIWWWWPESEEQRDEVKKRRDAVTWEKLSIDCQINRKPVTIVADINFEENNIVIRLTDRFDLSISNEYIKFISQTKKEVKE